MRLLIVGNAGGTNLGESFLRAAGSLGIDSELVDSKAAMDAPPWLRRFNWWVRGRRPTRLRRFGDDLVATVDRCRPEWILTTGMAPCTEQALVAIGRMGVERINFLSDDPFNPIHRASWFLKAVRHYDHIFSPRRANIPDLIALGCGRVSYLPFGYEERLQYPEPLTDAEAEQLGSDVLFVGGADRDRLPFVASLVATGLRVALYGDYWERFPETRLHSRGHVDPAILRKATRAARVAICLVRRANRDGHVMRSFEIPAIGTCMLAEDTPEHHEIFGEDGAAVLYFQSRAQMIEKLRWLLAHEDERQRLAAAAHRLILGGRHTYRDRLVAILRLDEREMRAAAAGAGS